MFCHSAPPQCCARIDTTPQGKSSVGDQCVKLDLSVHSATGKIEKGNDISHTEFPGGGGQHGNEVTSGKSSFNTSNCFGPNLMALAGDQVNAQVRKRPSVQRELSEPRSRLVVVRVTFSRNSPVAFSKVSGDAAEIIKQVSGRQGRVKVSRTSGKHNPVIQVAIDFHRRSGVLENLMPDSGNEVGINGGKRAALWDATCRVAMEHIHSRAAIQEEVSRQLAIEQQRGTIDIWESKVSGDGIQCLNVNPVKEH